MNEPEQVAAAAAAIAALALGQLSVIALVQTGLLSKVEAGTMLRQLAETNEKNGGSPNRATASILTGIANNIAAMVLPVRQ